MLGYTLMNKFGITAGCILMLILDPLMFASAGLIPFFFSRLLCKQCITSNLIDKMRFFKALAPLLEMQGFKMTTLVRLAAPAPKMAQNYMLAATKLRYKPFFFGSMLGAMPQTVVIGFLATQIKSVEDAFNDDDEDSDNTVQIIVGVVTGIIIVGLICSVANIAKKQLTEMLAEQE